MEALYSFLLIVGGVILAFWQYWWLPNRRERELDRRLANIHDKDAASVIVDSLIADGKRETQFYREQMPRGR